MSQGLKSMETRLPFETRLPVDDRTGRTRMNVCVAQTSTLKRGSLRTVAHAVSMEFEPWLTRETRLLFETRDETGGRWKRDCRSAGERVTRHALWQTDWRGRAGRLKSSVSIAVNGTARCRILVSAYTDQGSEHGDSIGEEFNSKLPGNEVWYTA